MEMSNPPVSSPMSSLCEPGYFWPKTSNRSDSSYLATPVTLRSRITDQVDSATEEANMNIGTQKTKSYAPETPEHVIVNGVKYLKVSTPGTSHEGSPEMTTEGGAASGYSYPTLATTESVVPDTSVFASPPIKVTVEGNVEFYVHRDIMTSLLAKNKIHTDKLQSLDSGAVFLPEENAATFRAMLKLLYSESYQSPGMEVKCTMTNNMVLSVYAMAVKYKQEAIKAILLTDWTYTYHNIEDFLRSSFEVYRFTGGDNDFRVFFKQNLPNFLSPDCWESAEDLTSEHLKRMLQSYLFPEGLFTDDLKDVMVDFVADKWEQSRRDLKRSGWCNPN